MIGRAWADRHSVSGLLARLRWRSDAATVAGNDRALMARTFIYLFGFGATLVLATAFFPAPNAYVPGVVVPALLAYGVVGVLVAGFDRLPRPLFVALPPIG